MPNNTSTIAPEESPKGGDLIDELIKFLGASEYRLEDLSARLWDIGKYSESKKVSLINKQILHLMHDLVPGE